MTGRAVSEETRHAIARAVRGGEAPAAVAARFGCSPSYAERLGSGRVRGVRYGVDEPTPAIPEPEAPRPPPAPAIVVRIATSGEDVCWYGGGDGTPACTDTAVWWRADTRRGEHRPERLRTCTTHAHVDLPPLPAPASDGWLIAKVAAGQSTGEEITLRDLDEHGQQLARAAMRDGRLVMVAGRLRLAGPPIPSTVPRPTLALLRPSRLPTPKPTRPETRPSLRVVEDAPVPAPAEVPPAPPPPMVEDASTPEPSPIADTDTDTDTEVSPAPTEPPTPEPAVPTPPKPRRPLGGRHNPITDREILDGLARHPDGAGPRALADTIERCHTSLRLPLRRLIKAGKVERTGGKNGPTVRYHLVMARTPKAKPDATVRELAALARESAPAPAPVERPIVEAGIPAHVLLDRRDRLVSKLGRARLRVLEVEGQLAAIADELARVSA